MEATAALQIDHGAWRSPEVVAEEREESEGHCCEASEQENPKTHQGVARERLVCSATESNDDARESSERDRYLRKCLKDLTSFHLVSLATQLPIRPPPAPCRKRC